jgi:hypothetical protein
MGGQPGGGLGALGALGIGGGPPGGAPGMGGLGFAGGAPGGPPAASAATWRFAIDDRTHSLIFRGTPEDLQTASEVVALAELRPDKPLPPLHRLSAFRLQHANAGDLVTKLNQLEIEVRLESFAGTNIMVALGSDSATREIADLVKALDIEVKGK